MDDQDYLNMPVFQLHEILECNHNTPKLFQHTYGQFRPFCINDTLYCYIPIPKCATQDTQRVLWTKPEIEILDRFTKKDIKDAIWFCGHREPYQRLGSAYSSWVGHIDSKGIDHNWLMTHVTLQYLLKHPELWDEHIQPQESFLQIFDDNNITYTTLEVDSNDPSLYSKTLSNFLGVDVTIGKY